MKNNERFDLSDRLIHFFRKVDQSSSNGFTGPETWGPGDIVEDPVLSPMFLLRNAVRLGRIWATWSQRKGKRTIYGPHPAVCFTEMPIGAFVEAGVERQMRGEAMSPYGLIFPKRAIFDQGGRPVIYGLSTSPEIPSGDDGGKRLIPAEFLPLGEQYRYVTYVPGGVDWTHEREWRWKCEEAIADREFDLPADHGLDIPGFDLNSRSLNGLGAIVKTDEQAERLIHDVLTVTDRLGRKTSHYAFVISLERLHGVSDLRNPYEIENALGAAAFTLEPFFRRSRIEQKALVDDFRAAAREAAKTLSSTSIEERGGCWLWLTDARHDMVRALVEEGLVIVNNDGRYLVDVSEFDKRLSLRDREDKTKRLAELLLERHGLNATYHSVLGKYGPDDVPFFADPPFDDRFHFNYGCDEDDF